jgi:NAD(P)-dependent dehydrogenase (short-subunit alcohol dehydrogenase family)
VPVTSLTSLSVGGGCAAKYSASRLQKLLEGFVPVEAENLLVGLAPADDAAVYKLDDERAIVFTLDFFPPLVDDPGTFGRLDVLVNSAGVGIAGTVEQLPVKHFELQVGVNLRGLFYCTQAAIPLLRESQGLIVNLASIAGTLPTPGLSTYGATKAAVISLTKSLNEELDGDGIRAIAICPGFVDTPMAEWSGLPGEEMIQPEDCAEVVRMCLRLSPHARIPQVVIERMGSRNGDVPLSGA